MRSQYRLSLQMGSVRRSHGGALNSGHRKSKRPFVTRRPMHVVLRAAKARGELSMLQPRHERRIDAIVAAQARKHFVKLQEYVNVGNHLHLKVRANSRDSFRAFLVSTTALIARAVTGARKGKPFGKFWDGLAFTRVLSSKFEERALSRYFDANALEARFGKEVRAIFLGKVKLVPS